MEYNQVWAACDVAAVPTPLLCICPGSGSWGQGRGAAGHTEDPRNAGAGGWWQLGLEGPSKNRLEPDVLFFFLKKIYLNQIVVLLFLYTFRQ